jgi:hypothetical protein
MQKTHIYILIRITILLLAMLFLYQLPTTTDGYAAPNQAGDVYMPFIAKLYSTDSGSGTGTVTGHVWDARTNLPLEGATVCYEDTICDTTDSQGLYLLPSVLHGSHFFTSNSVGYVEGEEYATVTTGYTTEVDFNMLPILDDGEFRVIVTWDDRPFWPPDNWPNDLNLHVWVTMGSNDHHIYIANRGNCENLDVEPYTCYEAEEQYGGGPDTIVVGNQGYHYKFGVLNYNDERPGVPPIDELEARIEIYDNSGLLAEYWVETASGEGDLWYVFDLSFGEIFSENCLLQYVEPGDNPPTCP